MKTLFFYRVGFLTLCLSLLLLTGCRSGFERYYVPQSLESGYTPVTLVRVQEIGTQDLEAVRKQLCPDATLIGSAHFTSGMEDTERLREFAARIGADMVLWKKVLLSSMPFTEYTSIPRTETDQVTTTVNGQTTSRRYYYTTYEQIPRTSTIDTYQHEVLFLRMQKP